MNRETTTWTSYDGREILIKDLEVRHLVNILNWIKETNELNPMSKYGDEITNLLIAEAELRIMQGWAQDIGIPRQRDDGSWELVNQTPEEKAREDAATAAHKKAMMEQKESRAAERRERKRHLVEKELRRLEGKKINDLHLRKINDLRTLKNL